MGGSRRKNLGGPTLGGGVRQDNANLTQQQPLLLGHNQKLESAAQTFAVTRHSSQLHLVRRERDGKLHGNNFAGLKLAAEGRPDAIQTEFAGSAPARDRLALAEHRHPNAHIKAIARESPHLPWRLGCRWCVVAQFRLSIADAPFTSYPYPAVFLSAGKEGDQPSQLPSQLCESWPV